MSAIRYTAASNHAEILDIRTDLAEIKALVMALTPAKTEIPVTPVTPKATKAPKNAKVMTRAALRDLKAQGKIPALVTCKEAVLLKGFKSWTLPSGAMRIAIREATEAKANA